jgi:hypothetical protein
MPTSVYFCSPKALNKPSRGRPHGSKNIATASIRWGFAEAYRLLGGVEGLVKWGKEKPDLFYPMLKSLIPAELAESGTGQPIRVLVYAPNQSSEKHLDLQADTPQPVVLAAMNDESDGAESEENQ